MRPASLKTGWNRLVRFSPRVDSVLWIVLLALAFGVFSARAESNPPVIVLSEQAEPINLKSNMRVLIDPTLDASLEDVIRQDETFELIQSRYIDFGLGDFRVWLKATLFNPGENDGVWRLDTGRPFSEELDIYLVRDGQVSQHVLSHRIDDTFDKRPLNTRTLTVDLTIPEQEIVDLYISYRSSSTTSLALIFGTPVVVSEAKQRETLIDMSVNSALMAMLFLALMFLTITGWRISLAFVAYIATGMLYVAHADGYTAQYLWPGLSISNDAMNLILMLLMSAAGINFGRVLFGFKKSWPAYNGFLSGYIFLAFGFAVIAYPLIDVTWLMIVAYALIPLGTLIQPVTGFVALRRNYRGASVFLAGALIILLAILYSVIAHLYPGDFDLDQTLDVGHLALLAETFAFAGAIVIRLLGLQNERDEAMSAELVAVREKLAMSSALRDSQQRYIEARNISRRRQEQLSSVSHDLQQPLSSLRTAISKMALENDDAGYQMHSALDYLEKLATDQLSPQEPVADVPQADGVVDVFSVNVILQNAYEMFRSEAEEKEIDLRLRSLDQLIEADAVSLMRVVSNLIHNAVRHTRTGGILLAARPRGNRIMIEVHDTGDGMSVTDIERLKQWGEKSELSGGSGLGLAIVQQISDQYDWRFNLTSEPERGTRARLYLPRHA